MLTLDTLDTVRQKLDLLMLALEALEARARVFDGDGVEADLRPIHGLVRELVELVREPEGAERRA